MAKRSIESADRRRAHSEAIRTGVDDARRRIADALDRGMAEAVVPASGSISEFEVMRQVLGRDGFEITRVTGEDGPYSVVHW